ncbi:7442_t:CDS:2, partial [Racocetra persica]
MPKFALIFLLVLSILSLANAGPVTYTLCQSTCNSGWVACYAASGIIGTICIPGLGSPSVVALCYIAHSACMATCAASALTPAP